MKQLYKVLKKLVDEMDSMEFHQLIREARLRIGLVQYSAAEHMLIPVTRLKTLENGIFRQLPKDDEIDRICDFYMLPKDKIKKKLESYVGSRKPRFRGDCE